MSLKAFPYHLKFKKPFKIASVERAGTDNLYLKFSKNGFDGWGEAVFPPYIVENQESAIKELSKLNWEFSSEDELFKVIARNQVVLKLQPSLACAMEACLLNWLANSKGFALSEVLGLSSIKRTTSYTIGISSNDEISKSVRETPEAEYFKLKVNEREIERVVEQYCSISDKPFVIDANQGFLNYKKALYWSEKLFDLEVEYFEQPFHKDDWLNHQKLKEATQIPIIADESFQRFNDLGKVEKAFDGINVKIIKTGGVLEAKRILLKAKELSLKTIVGCMSGSSTSINTASSLVALTDYVDLDGVYLIKNDPDLNSFV